MKKSRFTESQITGALKLHEAGKKVLDICSELKNQPEHILRLEEEVFQDGC